MSATASSTRQSASAVGASALTALVMIAATIAAAPTANAAQVQATAVWVEHSGVRSVAAAVAAAARDLLGSDHSTAASHTAEFSMDNTPEQPRVMTPSTSRLVSNEPLRESLLDLPPPAC